MKTYYRIKHIYYPYRGEGGTSEYIPQYLTWFLAWRNFYADDECAVKVVYTTVSAAREFIESQKRKVGIDHHTVTYLEA